MPPPYLPLAGLLPLWPKSMTAVRDPGERAPALVVWLDPGGRTYHITECHTLTGKTPVVPYLQQRDGWREPCRHCTPANPQEDTAP